MSYQKTIVCLAKWVKHGGYCIAGKEVEARTWIRPVSNREDEEIRPEECAFESSAGPNLFDIVSVSFLEPRPRSYQSENHLIDTGHHWKKKGKATWSNLIELADDISGPLWLNGYSSYYGTNDRIPESQASEQDFSLALIQPVDLTICVETEGAEFGNPRQKTRAEFTYDGHCYKLAVTDPLVRDKFWSRPGRHSIKDRSLICVSLGEIHDGHAYKLAAAIMTRDMEA